MGLLSMQHHSHHPQQGQPTTQQSQYSRPSSIVQQHHQAPQSQQHQAYPSAHSLYQTTSQTAATQHNDGLQYYTHASHYNTPSSATSGYSSADTSEMMAAAQMPRHHYPPMSYHTPQSNSPASVASPSQHDQHRSIYGQPPSQPLQQSMYYPTQQPYHQSMSTPTAPSPYAQHPSQHSHQTMTSQPAMMVAQTASHNPMAHHASQHNQASMANSPRHPKMESQAPLQHPKPQSSSLPQGHHGQNGTGPLSTPTGNVPAVNPNAAPGPIPATTPLVVRQDHNGVQWIAFEYSRDRVKMEYTIRCDVESVNTEELSPEFKTENCVYPRACCPKDQYRGNRQIYETECNTVGWALAQLNPPLRGKRGLIQRAVDSWRNSNQDPRLRSRRVRRMAKLTSRKAMHNTAQQSPHLAGAQAGMPGAPGMGKPSLASMVQPALHHPATHAQDHAQGTGEEVGTSYDDEATQPTMGPSPATSTSQSEDVRRTHAFTSYTGPQYPQSSSPAGSGIGHVTRPGTAIAASKAADVEGDEICDLFPNIPEAKKRKFILVDDNIRGSKLRVRVTLDSVDTREIPDSFRKSSSVYPRSYFPREMQSPPPSSTGTQFFADDLSDAENDGVEDTQGRRGAPRGRGHGGSRGRVRVQVPEPDNDEDGVWVPRTRRRARGKEVRLNDLGFRMAWLQSRAFAGRTVFLQRALDCYRTKTCTAVESTAQDVGSLAPHFETRLGKRVWNDRMKRARD